MMEYLEERLVGELVEFLDDLSLNIDLPGDSQDVDQSGPAQNLGDHFADQADLGHQGGELTGRTRRRCLLLKYEPGQGDRRRSHGLSVLQRVPVSGFMDA